MYSKKRTEIRDKRYLYNMACPMPARPPAGNDFRIYFINLFISKGDNSSDVAETLTLMFIQK